MDAFGAWLVWLMVAVFGPVAIGSADGLSRRARKVCWALWAIWVAPVALSGFLIVCTLIGLSIPS